MGGTTLHAVILAQWFEMFLLLLVKDERVAYVAACFQYPYLRGSLPYV